MQKVKGLGIPQGYTLTEGTSYAVAQVSATAALIISEYTEQQVISLLLIKCLNI